MSQLPRALRWYLWAVYLTTGLSVAYRLLTVPRLGSQGHAGIPALTQGNIVYLAIFVLLAYVGERTALSVTPSISQSLSTAIHVAAILILAPPYPVLVTLV